jgi:hypothetical protein
LTASRRPLIALLAAIVGGVLVGVLLLAAVLGGSRTASGTATPTAPATASGPRSTPDPSAAGRRIAEVQAQVPPIRGLQPKTDVVIRSLTRAGFEEELRRLYQEADVTEQFEVAGDLYGRLGLIEGDVDLQEVTLDMLGAGVIGAYFDDTKEMAVIDAGDFDATARMTLAHEYTHALQDQHFGLDNLAIEDVEEGDRALAHLALVEGDATQLMVEWAADNLSPFELLSVLGQSLNPQQQQVLASVPPVLRRQLIFPYVSGQQFVARLQADDGWAGVDAAYDDPPESTEQILHPEKYAAREEPLDVVLPDVVTALGAGWTERIEDTMGELNTDIWLSLDPDREAPSSAVRAAGWGGDRIASYDGPNGSWAVAWQTAWDTPADASEFRAGARAVTATLADSTVVLGEGGDTVIVLIASDEATLDLVRAPFESL